MTSATISSDSLSNLIDQCISDLNNGEGGKLVDLAGVFNAIAECNSEPHLFILPQGIGIFSSELLNSKSLTMVPVLPQETRDSHKKLIDSATDQATKALKEIKTQLCNNSDVDHKHLMIAVGSLFQQASMLNSKRRQFSRASQSQEGEQLPTDGLQGWLPTVKLTEPSRQLHSASFNKD